MRTGRGAPRPARPGSPRERRRRRPIVGRLEYGRRARPAGASPPRGQVVIDRRRRRRRWPVVVPPSAVLTTMATPARPPSAGAGNRRVGRTADRSGPGRTNDINTDTHRITARWRRSQRRSAPVAGRSICPSHSAAGKLILAVIVASSVTEAPTTMMMAEGPARPRYG